MMLDERYYIATRNFMRSKGYKFVCHSAEFDLVFCNQEENEIQLVNIFDYWSDCESSILSRSEFERSLRLFYLADEIPAFLIGPDIRYTEIGFFVDKKQPNSAIIRVHWDAL